MNMDKMKEHMFTAFSPSLCSICILIDQINLYKLRWVAVVTDGGPNSCH